MTTPFDADDIRALGLGDLVHRMSQVIPGPSAAVGRGRPAMKEAQCATTVRELAADPAFRMSGVDLPMLLAAGLALERGSDEPDVVRAWSVMGEPLEAIALDAPFACWPDDEDERAWLADLGATRRVAFVQPSSVVLLNLTNAGVHATWLAPPLRDDLLAPVLAWLEDSDDEWLVESIRARKPALSPWVSLVAAADLARLTADLRRHAAQLALGTSGNGPMAPRAWMRRLTVAHLDAVESMASSAADRLARAIPAVENGLAPLDDAWTCALTRTLVLRDEIEGVRALLLDARLVRAMGSPSPDAEPLIDRLDAALAVVDERLHPFLASMPVGLRIYDERLRRAFLGDPAAWWAGPAGR